ncbi:hypothetical protein [Aquihabitans sp. McL0605]|uniref:hypothetical protein n=1 Tax=Aquihabitans sp. McL0605 TaxID=3415671 RepID=UPI003CF08506
MSAVRLAAVWALVTLDCALMGYRLAMGRSLHLDKRRLHQQASIRAGLLGLIPIAAVTALALGLARPDGPLDAHALDDALGRFLVVGGAYAGIVLVGTALCLVPSVTVRTVASIAIFGPLTLLRPLIVVVTVAAAVLPDPSAPLVVLGLLVAVPGVAIEPILDRRIAAALSAAPAPAPAAAGATG